MNKVISRQEAAGLVQDGMTLGLLGFVTLSVPEDHAALDCRSGFWQRDIPGI